MLAGHKVVQYIKGSPRKWIFFPSESDLQVKTFCDTNLACCPNSKGLWQVTMFPLEKL